MRLASWNVNGLRAGLGPAGLKPLLDSLEADVICLQETKVTRDLLEEPLAIVEGYNSYFSFSRTRNGYSGVATFCKVSATPEAAEEGLSGLFAKHDGAVGYYGETEGFTTEELQALDSEGRAVITRHRIRTSEQQETTLTVINVYCPRADPEKPERGDFKLRFYRLLQARAKALLRAGGHVVILGDINTAHKPIDHCDPGDLESFQEHLGRRWLDSFLWEPDKDSQDGKCFVDTFRFLHPGQSDAYTCWCNVTGSRQLNYGTRIDYILADRALALSELQDAQLMPDVFGSDHCPVWVVLRSVCLGAPRCPPLCTRFLPEFAGTQQKLNHFLVKVERTSLPEERGQKRGGREPSVAGGSKKRRVGPPQKGQGDLRSFFKAGNGRPRATTNSANCQSVMKMRTAEDSGVEPPLDASGRTTDEHGVEEFAGGSQACAGSLREEPTLGMANGGALDCGKGTVPSSSTQSAALWKSLLPGPARPPHCKAHGEPCVLRTVKKPGPNSGRRFYVCARPLGKPSDPRSRCDFFLWASRGNP
ncbi:DNA-(apurinic or apyrimidinic site) endonuclease 2 isoform X1 [Zootoca vivipara]|uniref:DNA-(apurinic or apyrimidinic site) endonuclease 2 isoform X1 n=1 Tax=Zootoca vivipara TaxID=8524 RepID=UPI00293BB23B|nr:DNA-(apurinic or apyrimidinic site) endonuclease 2 isoform X1 [Zootoca vivipara]